jgi:hypothetical protein
MVAKKTKAAKAKKDKACEVTVRDLGNSDWWRLSRVYRELLPQLGKLTRKTLTDVRESGELRCVRLLNSGQTKPAGAKFWRSLKVAHEKRYFDRPDKYDPDVYVWRPWEVLPVPAPSQATKENEPKEPGRKRGRKPMHPWKMFVAAKAWEMHKAGGQRQLAAYFAQLCGDKFEWQPGISEINELLREIDY